MSGALDAQMVRELVTSISGLTQALQTSARGAERVADTNTALERGARDRSHSAAAGAGGLGGMVGDLAGARGLGLDALQVGGALAGGGITPAGQALGLLGSVAGGAAGGAVVGGPAGAVVGGALGGFQSALGIANTGASLDLQQAQLNDPGVGATARDIEQQRISGERDPSSTLGRVARSLPGAGAIGAIGGPLGAAMVSRLGGAAMVAVLEAALVAGRNN